MKKYSQDYMLSLYNKDNDHMNMVNIQKINTETRSRIDDIRAYAKISGVTKIGIAHCISFSRQAERLKGQLSSDFEVVTVDCKVGRLAKDVLLGEGWGSACNPILQAEYLNEEATELNIVMGLCVGHDILFSKYAKAPSTTLLVKDERYGNHPEKGLE